MRLFGLGLFLIASMAPQAALEGTWSARAYMSEKGASDPSRLQLQINLDDNGRNRDNWGQSIPRAAFTNLPADLDARKDVTFELRREAGRIAFRGTFENGRGVGYLTFTPDREFERVMEQQTNDEVSDRDLFSYAILDVSRAFVSELQAMGFGDVTLGDARKLRIHGVTTEFIAGLKAEGLQDPSLSDVLRFRIHGVTLDYIKEMRALGFAEDLDDIVQSRIHGVTPAFAKEMAALGYKNVDFDQLRQFRIHGVTPGYVKEMAALGYRDVSPRTIVKFRIHGITPSFVKELKDAGYTNLSDEELVDWAIHGRRLLRAKRR